MPVSWNLEAVKLIRGANLRVVHFTKGTWPEADGAESRLPVNRFLMPFADAGEEESFVSDAQQKFRLRPGWVYFIPQFHPARVRLSPELEFISIQFTLEFFGGVDVFSRAHFIAEHHDPDWFERADAAYQSPNPFVATLRLRAVAEDFAALQLEKLSESELKLEIRWTAFRQVCDYVENHGSAKTTVDELAELTGLRRETFSRKFTEAAGLPPKHYLNRSLVDRACRLLLRPNSSVRDTARELQFASEYYFSRFFHKHVGLPPGEYRKRRLPGAMRYDLFPADLRTYPLE